MFVTHLECTSCGLRHDWSRLQNLCTACGKPLFAVIDLGAVGKLDGLKPSSLRETLRAREESLWRYRELLPLPKDAEPISLGEGGTPLLPAKKFAAGLDVDLWIKHESLNPTQAFKSHAAKRKKVGSTYRRSKNRIGWKARRRSAANWLSNSIGNCQM